MSILDINKLIKKYIIASVFLMVFSIIYEYFSHNVYSLYMISAFIFPIIGIAVLKLLKNKNISYLTVNILNCLIITFSILFLLTGALNIYGTTNNLTNIYIIISIVLIIIFFISLRR